MSNKVEKCYYCGKDIGDSSEVIHIVGENFLHFCNKECKGRVDRLATLDEINKRVVLSIVGKTDINKYGVNIEKVWVAQINMLKNVSKYDVQKFYLYLREHHNRLKLIIDNNKIKGKKTVYDSSIRYIFHYIAREFPTYEYVSKVRKTEEVNVDIGEHQTSIIRTYINPKKRRDISKYL